MKILVTGTHFTPAVATIEELKKIDDTEVVYVGRKTTQEGDLSLSVESQVLPKLGVKFIPIITGRLQRSITFYTIPSLLKIPIGIIQALYIILSQKPDVILSFGGYVAVPVVIVGWLFSIPIIIHEQTLVPGLANKISSLLAEKVAIAFAGSAFKGEKVVLTGNPIRHEVLQANGLQKKETIPVVLIMGGNQGSHAINLAVEECINNLLKTAKVYHQTGDSKYRDFDRLSKLAGAKYTVKKWIGKEYPAILQAADLIVCRAGINTLTELAALGKPSLLVPINNKEQKKNAEYFKALGLADILPQSGLSGEALLKKIKLMLNNLPVLRKQAKQAKTAVITDAAHRLALETLLLASSPEL